MSPDPARRARAARRFVRVDAFDPFFRTFFAIACTLMPAFFAWRVNAPGCFPNASAIHLRFFATAQPSEIEIPAAFGLHVTELGAAECARIEREAGGKRRVLLPSGIEGHGANVGAVIVLQPIGSSRVQDTPEPTLTQEQIQELGIDGFLADQELPELRPVRHHPEPRVLAVLPGLELHVFRADPAHPEKLLY